MTSIQIDHEININGHILSVAIDASAHIYKELYGADADGNRGEMRTELEILEIKITDSLGNDITEKFSKKYQAEFDDIFEHCEELFIARFESEGYDCD
jgi:hypothetical protein